MKHATIIAVAAAALVSGCTSFYQKSESLLTGRPVSIFMESGVVPVNRKLIKSLVYSLSKEGHDPEKFADIDDDEYFDALKIEMRQEYDREYRLTSSLCEYAYEQSLNQYKLQQFVGGVAAAGFMPHSKAGRAFDNCMLQRGWEGGTQRMYDEISDLAWRKTRRG